MYTGDYPYISPNYKKEQYLGLEVSINSDDETFNKAIEMFKDRIIGRFLEQIDSLKKDCCKNGFSIMALECLLVETFAQFYHGYDNTKNVSKKVYKNFLKKMLRCFNDDQATEAFYDRIRCGVLHQAQTKLNSGLTCKKENTIYYQDDFLLVDVELFVNEMNNYFDNYCNLLKDRTQIQIRENFIKKMNFICKR